MLALAVVSGVEQLCECVAVHGPTPYPFEHTHTHTLTPVVLAT